MPWVRLDDGFADHPKIERCGYVAAWLHVVALCYSARHLTDGRIPKVKARRLADIPQPARHITTLLEVGLWQEDGDDYLIHDYLDFQPSRAAVEADRKREREKKRRQREVGMATRNSDGKFTGNPQGSPPGTPPGNPAGSPSVPDPTPTPNYLKGGENLRAAASSAPPPRCQAHINTDGPVPPCGACADARRSHEAWTRQNGNGTTPDPLAETQAAARARAEAGTAKVREINSEPADPQAAAKIRDLLQQHRLATRKDPA